MRSDPDKKGPPAPSAGRKNLVSLSDYLEAPIQDSTSEFRDLTENRDGPNAQADVDPDSAARSNCSHLDK